LKDEPRAASIIATVKIIMIILINLKSDATLVSMDKDSFMRLVGPVKDILKRNIDKYSKYVKQ
jgi:cAMP-dependent protein kinase regulator